MQVRVGPDYRDNFNFNKSVKDNYLLNEGWKVENFIDHHKGLTFITIVRYVTDIYYAFDDYLTIYLPSAHISATFNARE